MIIVIDNYDSFVYNLAQYLGELGWQPRVYRNDSISVEEIAELEPSHIVISPGPGTPDDAGVSNQTVKQLGGKIPILGVCLGHQCIGQVYGGKIVRAAVPMHGKSSQVFHDGKTIYRGLANPFTAARYHSLVIQPQSVPASLEVSARTESGEIMGVRHRDWVVEGVQFHPESIMTDIGHELLRNFLDYTSGIRNAEIEHVSP
ncbi:MAG: aminodeoxychorismate/anthranilate synthase component II [Dehalococcoidia bacterium]|nr:aminodeoxychorismate/anthranilate synthase component II [Dehalococcoidia bacterium]